jgi:hypothetical protein
MENFQPKLIDFYSPFCVQATIIELVGLRNGGRLSPINLVTFAGTQNGEYKLSTIFYYIVLLGIINNFSKNN